MKRRTFNEVKELGALTQHGDMYFVNHEYFVTAGAAVMNHVWFDEGKIKMRTTDGYDVTINPTLEIFKVYKLV